jgi:hypothetical protein
VQQYFWIDRRGTSDVYLFQPRTQPADAAERDSESLEQGTPFDIERYPTAASPAIQPGSAAEWALGELIIRLCNGGKPLRPDPPAAAPPE